MRKIILVFTIIISFFIFDVSFKETSQSEFRVKSTLAFNLKKISNYNTTATQFKINNDGKKEFLQDLETFLKENKISASIIDSGNANDFSESDNWYVYFADSELSKQIFTIEEGKYLDFSKKSKQYYTTDLNDDNSSFHISYLDKVYNDKFQGTINVYPLENYRDTNVFKQRSSVFVNFHDKDLGTLIEKVSSSSLSKYVDENSSFGEISTLDETNKSDEYLSIKIIGVVILSVLILMICYIVQIRKEIVLRKMFGMNDFYIVNKIFTKDLVFLCLVYALTQVISYVFYVGNLYPNSIAFIEVLIKYFSIFILSVIVVYLIVYFAIKLLVNISFLKKEKSNEKLLWLNFSLKLIAVVLLMQPCITQTQNAIESTQLLFYLNNNEERISQSVYMKGIYDDGDIKKYDEIRRDVLGYFDEHGGYFQNFTTYSFSQMEDNPMDWIPKYPFPYLEVNINYLKDYQILDTENKQININELAQDTLLIPEKYKEENLTLYDGYPSVYIKDGNEFYNNSVSTETGQFNLKDPIIKVYTSIPVNHEMGNGLTTIMMPIKNENTLQDLHQFTKDQNIEKNVQFGSNEGNYRITYNYTKNRVLQSWVMMFIQWLTILVFLFETIYLFVIQERRLYSLRYLFGESFIERYGNLFITNLAIYFIVAIIGVISRISLLSIVSFVVPIMIFEALVSYLMIRMFERKKILSSLKGE